MFKVNFFDTPHAKVEKKLVVEEQVAEPVKKVEPTENKKQEEEKKVTKTMSQCIFLEWIKMTQEYLKK